MNKDTIKALRIKGLSPEEIVKDICPQCSADKDVWREVFQEEHYCKEVEP